LGAGGCRRYNLGMKTPLKIAGGVLAVLLVAGGGGLAWLASRLAPDVALGTAGLDATLTAHDGTPLSVSSLRGKYVLLDFWSST
jgi:cytochrome oxidase Cu insertion factor (SCO1/SenC/PrrC family)